MIVIFCDLNHEFTHCLAKYDIIFKNHQKLIMSLIFIVFSANPVQLLLLLLLLHKRVSGVTSCHTSLILKVLHYNLLKLPWCTSLLLWKSRSMKEFLRINSISTCVQNIIARFQFYIYLHKKSASTKNTPYFA